MRPARACLVQFPVRIWLQRRASTGGLTDRSPGSTVGEATPSESMAHIADSLNRAHKDESTGSVITVLENMASFLLCI